MSDVVGSTKMKLGRDKEHILKRTNIEKGSDVKTSTSYSVMMMTPERKRYEHTTSTGNYTLATIFPDENILQWQPVIPQLIISPNAKIIRSLKFQSSDTFPIGYIRHRFLHGYFDPHISAIETKSAIASSCCRQTNGVTYSESD